MGTCGYQNRGWLKRFTAEARPGPYLRVVEEGEIGVGDTIEVVHRPDHDITVTTMFRALLTDRTLLPSLLEVDGLVDEARRAAEKYVATTRP
jgi:MOSC domain-containing protein YiiM